MIATRRKFRASQAAQLFACSASAEFGTRARAAMPPSENAAATAGRWGHAAAARELITKHGATFQGDKLDEPPVFKASGFHQWMVDFYLAAILELTSADMAIEVEGEFEAAFDRFDLTGHIDALGLTADATEAVGFDFKSGSDHVDEAGDNAQVLAYVVLLLKAYPELRKVTFYIVQPQNNPDEGFERITEITLEGAALHAAATYLENEFNRACDNPYSLNSDGWKQCRYCPAALVCPALLADIENMKMTLTPEAFTALKLRPDMEDLARLEITAKKLSPIFEQAHDEFKDRLAATNAPFDVDGTRFFLEDRPGKRSIEDNVAAAEALSDLPDAVYHRCYEFKPAAIEGELAAHLGLPKTSKKGPSGKSVLKDRLGHLIEQKINKVLKIA